MAHDDDEQCKVCVFTDASDSGWSVIIMRAVKWDPDAFSPAAEQHEPLLFLSGTFKDAQRNWSAGEKEAFPIIAALDKADVCSCAASHFFCFVTIKTGLSC